LFKPPGFVAEDGNYAEAGFVLRCAADEAWRRGGESNPRIKVLQTSALPLGYRAFEVKGDIL